MDKVVRWFVMIILIEKKYIVDHSCDPPWDFSGQLLCTYENFRLTDYETLQDFLENEYTGQSIASFMSNCGFFTKRMKKIWMR
ncbi:hypothetical protein [Massilibacterium senegalense]|uniref:hypothetical protein n=1 Tax=Massilibacterium senegalense TaxID=1632858 RepID=UPI0007818CED|nr:hypothetical protein [Massilibacterium senegalense]